MTEIIIYVVVLYLASLGVVGAINTYILNRPRFKVILDVGLIAFWVTVTATFLAFGWQAIIATIAMNALVETFIINKK
jgi:hypothetical protein